MYNQTQQVASISPVTNPMETMRSIAHANQNLHPTISIFPYVHQTLQEMQRQTDQLRGELYAKQANETVIIRDYLIPNTFGKGMLLVTASGKKTIQATSFTVENAAIMLFPSRTEKENHYLIEVSVCGITKALLISETEYNYLKSFKNILTKAGCVIYNTKSVADEKRILSLVQNYITENFLNKVAVTATAGWMSDGTNYVYEGFELSKIFPDNFGISNKILVKTASPDVDNIVKLHSVFRDTRIFEAFVCWLIYSLTENFIHPSLRLKKEVLLDGDLNICRDIAFLMLKTYNREEHYDLPILGESENFTSTFLQAKDETTIIFDAEKSDKRYLKEQLSKRFRYLTSLFSHEKSIKGNFKVTSTVTIISNNAIDEIEPENTLRIHIDNTVIDEEKLISCSLEADPFIDLITIITDYLSLKCGNFNKELQEQYLVMLNDTELNNVFSTPDSRKVYIVFEYMMELFKDAVAAAGNPYNDTIKETVKHILFTTEKNQDNDIEDEDVVFLFKDALKNLLNSGRCNIIENNSEDCIDLAHPTVYYDASNFYLTKDVYERSIYQLIQKNISARAVLSAMKGTGHLITGKEPDEYTTKHTINGVRGRYLCFKRSLVDVIGEISYFN